MWVIIHVCKYERPTYPIYDPTQTLQTALPSKPKELRPQTPPKDSGPTPPEDSGPGSRLGNTSHSSSPHGWSVGGGHFDPRYRVSNDGWGTLLR